MRTTATLGGRGAQGSNAVVIGPTVDDTTVAGNVVVGAAGCVAQGLGSVVLVVGKSFVVLKAALSRLTKLLLIKFWRAPIASEGLKGDCLWFAAKPATRIMPTTATLSKSNSAQL